jgi:predicted MFS family arabinose efflux permease
MSEATGAPRLRLRVYLIAFSVTRGVINTMYRMVYPFMTVFARGLGVPVEQVAAAVAVRSSLGLAAPLLGSTADRHGRTRAMLLGLSLFIAGTLFVAAWPSYWPFVVALLLTGGGKIIFDPAMQAQLGDRVGYTRRGQAIALTELGWSLAYLVGVPVMGWLIARSGWTAPFPWLAGLAATAAVILWRILPADAPARGTAASLRRGLRQITAQRAALAALAVGLVASAANETVNIVFGAWLEASFGLRVAALGAAAAVLGLAELSGEGLVATVTDRLGKRRAVTVGLVLNGLAGLLLPVLARSTVTALVALFVFYLTFEFTIVSSISLMTELVPEARATLMSSYVAALSAGRVLGAGLGLALFTLGIRANTAAAVALNILAILLVVRGIRHPEGRG